jgi:hypothetical protein
MSTTQYMRYLKISLVATGATLIFGIPLLTAYRPAGWAWTPKQMEYEQMIMGVYAKPGVFLILAAKNPLEHRSLIWFTVWSSVVHAAIMNYQALVDETERRHLLGDVPALYLIALVLGYLMYKVSRDSATS